MRRYAVRNLNFVTTTIDTCLPDRYPIANSRLLLKRMQNITFDLTLVILLPCNICKTWVLRPSSDVGSFV